MGLERGASVPGAADVVVVGAGFAGSSAALQITRAGRSVQVLEARDRIGGRVVNHPLGDGQVVEAGGQWIGATQDRMYALARELGLDLYATHDEGLDVTVLGDSRTVGRRDPAVDAGLVDLFGRLDAMASEVPVDAPWSAPRAREWDSQTLQTWLDANIESPEVNALVASMSYAVWGAEPRDLSLLFAVFYVAAAGTEGTPGTFERLVGTRDAAQQHRFVGGSQLLAQRIADALATPVVLSAPVRQIDWWDDGVRVIADGHTVEAQRAIVAVPPPLAAGIRYAPALPTSRAQLLQRLPMGSMIEVEAIYERPFWREAGLNGSALITSGPVRVTFDNTLSSGSPGILIGFIGGEHARRWSHRSPGDRRAAVLGNFSSVVGDGALDPVDYFEVDWPSEPWTRGGPVALPPPGVLLDYEATIREPVGPIHWAGTETATYWNGYMEGAVRSGERAASEVLPLLS